ncbi:lamin tail domain-containing protein [Candidatus Saccharibacteria bacterium]|nr:lamin tail domain-containing protein [Candidatus Saccharibacteria bacterium]
MKKFTLFSLILMLAISVMPLSIYAVEIPKQETGIFNSKVSDDTLLFALSTTTLMPLTTNTLDIEDPNAPDTPENPEQPTSSRQLIISEIAARICPENQITCTSAEGQPAAFVEIYNDSESDFLLSGWQLQYAPASMSGWSRSVAIDVELGTRDYLALPMAVGSATDGYVRIIDENGQVVDIVGYGNVADVDLRLAPRMSTGQSVQRCELPDGTLNGFALFATPTRGFGMKCPEPEPPMPVNECSGLIISEIGANLDKQFVEIYNPTNAPIDLSGCQIQTNRNKSIFAFGEESLAADSYRVIWIADTPLTLTKTTTGTVYILSSDGQNEVNAVSYAGLAKETSWALVDGEWRQTYAMTPGVANIWQAYPLCEEGYERNLETGRCRKIPVENILAPCPEGQYRNPETNRCRKIDTNSLVPCKEGQERNPLTNRCRNIPTDNEPKPCAEGYERNPETNSCRKATQSGAAAFAIDGGSGGGASGLWKWGAAGALLAMFSVVAWQYRTEIGRGVGFAKRYFSKKEISAETT